MGGLEADVLSRFGFEALVSATAQAGIRKTLHIHSAVVCTGYSFGFSAKLRHHKPPARGFEAHAPGCAPSICYRDWPERI